MDLEILPYEGVGPIKFGMTPTGVRQVVAGEFKTFLKSKMSAMETDSFLGKGIYAYYKLPGLCEAVEMALPADPTFQGSRLIGCRFDDILKIVRREDPLAEVDSTGLTSLMFGFGLFVPDVEENPDATVEGVIVFEKGYYGR